MVWWCLFYGCRCCKQATATGKKQQASKLSCVASALDVGSERRRWGDKIHRASSLSFQCRRWRCPTVSHPVRPSKGSRLQLGERISERTGSKQPVSETGGLLLLRVCSCIQLRCAFSTAGHLLRALHRWDGRSSRCCCCCVFGCGGKFPGLRSRELETRKGVVGSVWCRLRASAPTTAERCRLSD